jgi:glyoxylase-like metal-dependent hydrolase (beta-lactamase superfamily II)
MVRQILSGIHTWSVFSEQKGFDFNGYAIETPAGTVVIDPPDPGRDGWEALDALAPYEGVYVTNRNHSRSAAAFRERYGAPVRMHEDDAERAEVDVDETLSGDEILAEELTVVHAPGKSPGEIAFHVPARRAAVVGDLVIGVPPGELSTYPDEVIRDRAALQSSAAKLAELEFDALLLCDGHPLERGGRQKLREFLAGAAAST